MNKILVIKQSVLVNNTNADMRKKIAKSISDIWNETGIISIPVGWEYEFIDCDKFMGVMIDKDIVNERFENGCLPESSSIRVSRDMAEILRGNCTQLEDGTVIPGPRSFNSLRDDII